MKYSQSAFRARCFLLAMLFPLLTACGGGSGDVAKNSQTNINTGQNVTGQNVLDCQSQPGTSDVCGQAPDSSQGSGAASSGITTGNAAHVTNSILGVITNAFDLGGVNGIADSLVTATQLSYRPAGFDLPSFALQQLIQADATRRQNLLAPPTVTGLLVNSLNVTCDSGSYSQDTTTNPESVIVTFTPPDAASQPCRFNGVIFRTGQLTISDFLVTSESNFEARFTFTNLTIEVDQKAIQFTGSMRFSSRSEDGLTGTGQILSVSDSQQSNSGGSLGITVDGETNTLTGFTIDYSFNLATNTNTLNLDGTISSSIPGAPFRITTLSDLQKSTISGTFSDSPPGPFARGSLQITSSEGSELILNITSAIDDVQLQVDGVSLDPISWASLLRS